MPDAEPKGEVETFRQALVEALEQQTATSQILQSRNREFAEAQAQQSAMREILRIIASSPTDLQTAMNVVAESAARFCGATDAAIWRLEGESLRFVAREARRE